MKRTLALIAAALTLPSAFAGVLPEPRADVMRHVYDGGGMEIDGWSILGRASLGKSVSVSGNYYTDSVSSASIDVLTQASPYSEERTEYSVGMDYLRNDTIMSVAVTKSDESDYEAKTLNLGVSQEVFGGLTTVSLGYGRGSDVVGERGTDRADDADHWRYRVGVSQVLTRNIIMSLNYEAAADEGFLNNPYRQVRYVDPDSTTGYSFQAEVYPRTRDSNAVAVHAKYYLPWRAAASAGYRFFNDSWGIEASTVDLGYVHPVKDWTFEAGYRYYTQTAADFYSDLFPFANAQNFLARDKELSTFTSHTVRAGASYEWPMDTWIFKKGSANAFIDHVMFSYDDFRNIDRTDADVGAEPTYEFDANIYQFFFSFWF